MNIALLEDNPDIGEFLVIALEMAGHHAEVYTQGHSLLARLLSEDALAPPLSYDLLMVDLLLPGGLSGLEVIARIRQVIPPGKLPIIIISGAAASYFVQAHRDFPDILIVRKPFEMKTLLRVIEELTRP
jgi:DNA-binding response OmpR family regulator